MEARRTPPKLSLNSLTRHKSEPDGLKTPPLFRTAISVPFLWEDKPGKPRKEPVLIPKPKKSPVYVRKLDLPVPPRIIAQELRIKASHDKNVVVSTTSPTSVLNGPRPFKKNVNERKKGVRWFERKGKSRGNETDRNLRRESDGSVSSLSSSEGYYSSSCCGYDEEEKTTSVKIRRFRKQRSLMNLSFHGTSYFWAGIYERLKLVTPWHRN